MIVSQNGTNCQDKGDLKSLTAWDVPQPPVAASLRLREPNKVSLRQGSGGSKASVDRWQANHASSMVPRPKFPLEEK